jgi:outer membrane lipoprotein carrier protein
MKSIFLGILTILFISPFASANNGDVLLKKVQDKYSSILSFSADFMQYSPNNKKITGKFYYKKENNIKIETGNSTIISNGSTNWNYNKKQNKVIITGYDDSDASMFSFKKMIFDFPSSSKVKTDGNDSNVLMLIPDENSDLNFAQAKLWINNDNLIKKIEITGKNDSQIIIELSNYKLNQNFSDSQFSFTPPEGSRVIDLR